jgi:GntR family transcriptional repressor for pyruvate dehydrogenase complex
VNKESANDLLNSQFKKIKRTAAPEIVLDQIKSLILNRKLKPGDKLPTERDLAEMIGVSRPPLREALKTLEALGIIQIKHGSGIYVSEPNMDFATFPITVMLNRNTDIIKELIEAREIVEVQIVRLAAQKIEDKDFYMIKELLDNMKSEKYLEKLDGVFNFEFEELIAKLVGNRILAAIQKATHEIWQISLQKISFEPLPVEIINDEHNRIFDAIKTRNADSAMQAMAYHLRAPLRKVEEDAAR